MSKYNNKKTQYQKNYSSQYNRSNNAYDYDVPVQPYAPKYGEPKTVVHVKHKTVIKKEAKHVRVPKRVLITYVYLFLGACFMLTTYAMKMNLQIQIESLNYNIEMMKQENASIQKEIDSKIDYDEIYTIATEVYGMHEPEAYQIAPITVPDESYTVQNDVSE